MWQASALECDGSGAGLGLMSIKYGPVSPRVASAENLVM
jgi:hypothetical protein